MYILLFVLIVIIVLLLMNTRVKIIINQGYLYVYIYKIKILKLKKNETEKYAISNIKKHKFNKKDYKYLNILKSIDFRKIKIEFCGYQKDYYEWTIAYGIFNALLSLPLNYFKDKNIDYSYKVYFNGKPYLYFESIFYFKLGKILLHTIKIRRSINGKRSSDS